MPFHDPNYPNLEWIDVAPLVYDLHDLSLDPYMVRWPRLAWLALEEHGLTSATTEVDLLDSKLRAASLTLLHLDFLNELSRSTLVMDYDDWLEGTITLEEMELVLARKYGCSPRSECIRDAFETVYLIQLPDIVRALHGYFGTFTAAFQSLIYTASGPGDREPSFTQMASAHDFLRVTFEEIGGERIDDELCDSAICSVHRPSNKVH